MKSPDLHVLGRGYVGNDPDRLFVRFKHHDRSIRRGHLVRIDVQYRDGSEGPKTFIVERQARVTNGVWWAELAAVKPPLHVAGARI